jgi:hypothetical protein
MSRVLRAWSAMHGNNAPIHKYKIGDRDFDLNIEGVAHYGLIPDWLQDLRNIGMSEQELAALFMGAEDYIEMWERTVSRTDPSWSAPDSAHASDPLRARQDLALAAVANLPHSEPCHCSDPRTDRCGPNSVISGCRIPGKK